MKTITNKWFANITLIFTVAASDPPRVARSRAGGFRVLFLLAGWLALPSPLRADSPPTYLYEINASAVPGGFQPNFIALDRSNNVYVTDYNGVYGYNRVVKLAANGLYLTQWGSYGIGNG